MARSKATGHHEVIVRRRERWQQLLGRWRQSGWSQARFCRRWRIPLWQFSWWKKRLEETAPAVPAAPCGPPAGGQEAGAGDLFVPLRLSPAALPTGRDEVELTLRGGRVLRFDVALEPAKLLGLVVALEERPC